jgi:hypothetical protein
MMKFLVLLASFSAAAAELKITRKSLTEPELKRIHKLVDGGNTHVLATDQLAKLFGVETGHKVPAKVARGSVKEHQDKHADGEPATALVNLLYAGLRGEAKFMLRDLRSGAEHSVALEPGDFISYENEFFTHRVDADASSERWLLGPASLRRGLLEAVGSEFFCPGGTYDPLETTTYECNAEAAPQPIRRCCTVPEDCLEGAECIAAGCGPVTTGRRNIRFGAYKVPIQGQCTCEPGLKSCQVVVNGMFENDKCVDDEADLYNAYICPCDTDNGFSFCAGSPLGCIDGAADCAF